MSFASRIPNTLTISRFFIAGLLVCDALDRQASGLFAPLFILGALTDYLDGLSARKLGAMTVRGAVLDGYADIALYSAALAGIWLLFPQVMRKHLLSIVGLLVMQLFSWGFSCVRFGRITSYHSYAAKAWGVMLFISLAFLFVFSSDLLLIPMFVVAAASLVEDIAITAILPGWQSEIRHFVAAIAIRHKRGLSGSCH